MTLVQENWPKLQQMYKKGEVGLVEQRSFVGCKYMPWREKKLKIALLNEADFMVKLRFESCKLCFANICAPVTWVKYLKEFNSSLFPYWGHAKKKAQNSIAQRGRLHGEIKVWKLELVFCKYLCTSYLGEIFERVQFVPFSLLSWLRSVHFVPYKYKMRGKSIWNIWTRIKWEAKLANLKWTPLMGLNQ